MLAALGGSLCASINLVTMKKYGRHGDPFVLNFLGMGIGTAGLLAMSAALESWPAVVWSRSNVLAILYLSIFGSVIAFSAYYYLIKKMDATVVSLSTLIIPIVALILGRAFLDETVTPLAVTGIATILAGVTIAIWPVGAGRLPSGAVVNTSGPHASR
jgi:drug/metabolite transporter (DMT)-like permease